MPDSPPDPDGAVERMKASLDSDEASEAVMRIVRRLLSNMAVMYDRHGDPTHVCSSCYGWRPKNPEDRKRRVLAEQKFTRKGHRRRRERP